MASGLKPVLTYLDAALAPETSPAIRLLALLCLLRADPDGVVRLPRGLLRSWRLANGVGGHLAELARQHWLREEPAAELAAVTAHINDSLATAVLRGAGRGHRGRLLHQAAQLLHEAGLHGQPDAEQLAALRTASCQDRGPAGQSRRQAAALPPREM
jgi:hypothetical protein